MSRSISQPTTVIPDAIFNDIADLLRQPSYYLLFDKTSQKYPTFMSYHEHIGDIAPLLFVTSLPTDTSFLDGTNVNPEWQEKSYYELFAFGCELSDQTNKLILVPQIHTFCTRVALLKNGDIIENLTTTTKTRYLIDNAHELLESTLKQQNDDLHVYYFKFHPNNGQAHSYKILIPDLPLALSMQINEKFRSHDLTISVIDESEITNFDQFRAFNLPCLTYSSKNKSLYIVVGGGVDEEVGDEIGGKSEINSESEFKHKTLEEPRSNNSQSKPTTTSATDVTHSEYFDQNYALSNKAVSILFVSLGIITAAIVGFILLS